MEGDSSTATAQNCRHRLWQPLALWVAVILLLSAAPGAADSAVQQASAARVSAGEMVPEMMLTYREWRDIIPPSQAGAALLLLLLSAFFSASEIAFFSLHSERLRIMRSGEHPLERLAARLMNHPGNLLTSILMGNTIVNVLFAVVLAAPMKDLLVQRFHFPLGAAYPLALLACAGAIILVGEVLPKVAVVHFSERFVGLAAIPVFVANLLLAPLRKLLLLFVRIFFRISGFSRVRPAPFITDEEFTSLLHESEAQGVIEKDEREMIQGVIESNDVTVREILIPRPDMVAIQESATIGEALELFREQEYSRMPVYSDNFDHITGILYAKDLLPFAEQESLTHEVKTLTRRVHFVPGTMTVAKFVKTVQRLRSHMAIVVDEYGGTEGLVTLQDALREVIGDFAEEGEEEEPMVVQIEPRVYRVDGGLPVYDLEEITGIPILESDHATVAGFVMDLIERIPEAGEEIEHLGVRYTVEQVDGKRIAQLRIQVPAPLVEEVER